MTFSFYVRWNHTPFDESSANGYKEIADMVSEAIRHWEEDEIKNEGEATKKLKQLVLKGAKTQILKTYNKVEAKDPKARQDTPK